jgi:hypothetical protein
MSRQTRFRRSQTKTRRPFDSYSAIFQLADAWKRIHDGNYARRLGKILLRFSRRCNCSGRPAVRRRVDQSGRYPLGLRRCRSCGRNLHPIGCNADHVAPYARTGPPDQNIRRCAHRDRRLREAGRLLDAEQAIRSRHYLKRWHVVFRLLVNQPAYLSILISGLSIVCGFAGGISWLIPGFLVAFTGAMANA